MIPKECVFEKDSLDVVFVQNGEKFVQREVQLAFKGEDFIEIKEGVAEGEKLSLSEPGSSQLK